MPDLDHTREVLRLLEGEGLEHMPLAAELRRELAGKPMPPPRRWYDRLADAVRVRPAGERSGSAA